MTGHRVRLDDYQLRFLIMRMEDLFESDKELKQIYQKMMKKAENEYPRERYRKANEALCDVSRRAEATKEMIRIFRSVLKGGKPRTSYMGRFCTVASVNQKPEGR